MPRAHRASLLVLLLFLAASVSYASNLKAADAINIDSENLNILASQDVNTSKESSDHKHLNISYGTAGGGSVSASMDRSKGSSDGITSTNSQLNANNININTEESTTIAGANVAANDTLELR